MTQNEIKRIYSQIENLSAYEIKELVDEEIDKSANIHSFTMGSVSLLDGIFGGAVLGAACGGNTSRDRDIKDICKDSVCHEANAP